MKNDDDENDDADPQDAVNAVDVYIIYSPMGNFTLLASIISFNTKTTLPVKKKGGTELGQWVLVKYRRVCVYNFALI